MATKGPIFVATLAIIILSFCITHAHSAAVVTRSDVQEEVGGIKFKETLEKIAATLGNFSWPLCEDLQNLLSFLAGGADVSLGCEKPESVFYNLDGLIPNVSVKGELGILRNSLAFSFDKRTSEITAASIMYNGEDEPLEIEWGYTIPSFGIEMEYELREVIAFGFVPIPGKGMLRVSLDGLEIKQTGQIPLADPVALIKDTFNIEVYSHKIKLRIQGLFNGNEELAQTVSDALSSLLFTELNSLLNQNLNIILNSELGRQFIPDLLDYQFFNGALGWNSVTAIRDFIGKPAI